MAAPAHLAFLLDFDLWVETFSLVIAFLIAAFSFSAYLITKQKRHELFSFAFLLLSVGIFLSAVFNSAVEFETFQVAVRGYLPLSYALGFTLFISMILVLSGYITIFIINEQIQNRKVALLLYGMVLLAAVVAHEFYIMYHATSFIVIALLFRHFYTNYAQEQTTNRLLVMLAFASLLVSQLFFTLVVLDNVFYIIGNLFRLLGFLLFLFALVSIYFGDR